MSAGYWWAASSFNEQLMHANTSHHIKRMAMLDQINSLKREYDVVKQRNLAAVSGSIYRDMISQEKDVLVEDMLWKYKKALKMVLAKIGRLEEAEEFDQLIRSQYASKLAQFESEAMDYMNVVMKKKFNESHTYNGNLQQYVTQPELDLGYKETSFQSYRQVTSDKHAAEAAHYRTAIHNNR